MLYVKHTHARARARTHTHIHTCTYFIQGMFWECF